MLRVACRPFGSDVYSVVSTGTSRRRSGTNRLGHELNRSMTRTIHRENPRDNDADDDEDELSGIVLCLPFVFVCLDFFAILSITHS